MVCDSKWKIGKTSFRGIWSKIMYVIVENNRMSPQIHLFFWWFVSPMLKVLLFLRTAPSYILAAFLTV